MTKKDQDQEKELQGYLSEWQKRHQEYLEKKAAEEKETLTEENKASENESSVEAAKADSESVSEESVETVQDEEESSETDETTEVSDEDDVEEVSEEELADSTDETEMEGLAEAKRPQIDKQHLYRALPVLIISSFLLLLALYFITPLGTLKTLLVTGNERVTQDEIIKNAQIDSRDYTLTTYLNRAKHAQQIKKTNSWIESAEIVYQFPVTFQIKVKEYTVVGYEASSGNIYPVLSNGNLIEQPVKKESLPENYSRLNLSDKAKVKKYVAQLTDISDAIKANIQTVDLTPSKATPDLLTLTMRDGHKVLVPLSDISKKLPYYTRVQSQLTEPSIVDMEAGIFSYPERLAQREADTEENAEETAEESDDSQEISEQVPAESSLETNSDTNN